MKGEFFKTSLQKYLLCLFFLLTGSLIAVRFVLWGIDAIQAKASLSSAVFCFVFAAGGLLFGSFSLVLYRFNRNAFLTLENGKIDARFGWDKELHTDINNVTCAEIQGKHLKLFINEKVVWIYGLINAKEICQYIRSLMPTNNMPDLENAKAQYHKSKKAYNSFFTATVISFAFLLLHLLWCVILTEGKALNDFSQKEDAVFIAFLFAEVFTVLLTFVFAHKCGKKREIFHQYKHAFLSACAFECKDYDLDKYPDILYKKYFDHYTYRVVVFAPKETVFAYMLERFDGKTLSWKSCYTTAKSFERLTDLYEDFGICFADVILED